MQHAGVWRTLAVCLAATMTNRVLSVTPDSRLVETMVKRAARFLSDDHQRDLGHMALSSMALLKAGYAPKHPVIRETINECKQVCEDPELVAFTLDIYGTSVVGLLLCEIDPSLYRGEVSVIIRSLEQRQKSFGGWGYPKGSSDWSTGDTSMTQYAVLCSWVARNTGAASISQESIRKVGDWLLRTQDVNGAWGYQGKDPGRGIYQRQRQEEIRHSLCVAGLGSMYICADMLGFTSGKGVTVEEDELPRALKPVLRKPNRGAAADAVVDFDRVKQSIRDGNRWYRQNYRINPSEYGMYYLYTLERYQSFRELAEGRKVAEPKWYNDGMAYLRSTQQRDGSWDFPGGTGKLADTAFAVLFLTRSAQKTIQVTKNEYHGTLTAGRGLPTNTADVRMRRGNIVRSPFQGTADALLAILEDADHPDLDTTTGVGKVRLSQKPQEYEQQLLRMRRLAHAESFDVRMTAVKTLASIRELDNVPTLIYALSDPDLRVMQTARDGLRFSSRKLGGFGLRDEPTPKERSEAIKAWKQWYLAIRPEAFFPQ